MPLCPHLSGHSPPAGGHLSPWAGPGLAPGLAAVTAHRLAASWGRQGAPFSEGPAAERASFLNPTPPRRQRGPAWRDREAAAGGTPAARMTPEGGAARRGWLPRLGASAGVKGVVQGRENGGGPREPEGRGRWSGASGLQCPQAVLSSLGSLCAPEPPNPECVGQGAGPPLRSSRRPDPPAVEPHVPTSSAAASPAAPSGGARAPRLQPGGPAAEMLGVGTGKAWKPLGTRWGGQFHACWRAGLLLRASDPAQPPFPNAYSSTALRSCHMESGKGIKPKALVFTCFGILLRSGWWGHPCRTPP
ncbi:uncharacterized protein LOC104653299 [Saimiri boliviensis]|uniref:uncharacterized protein LOC104653299 n=1 Tax=Saimiri boliviensis TaxID=27679 RepID=UPI000533E720|nr:translation initiation factor IF-2-like [Saimiri boliviensis boliviensis]